MNNKLKPLKVQNHISQSVPIGLRKIGNKGMDCCLHVAVVIQVSYTNKAVPQCVSNEGLFQAPEKEFQSARHDVDVYLL